MVRIGTSMLALSLCLVAASCGGGTKTTIASGDDPPEDQWSRGVWLYGQHCASCHGEDGEGNEDAPALIGKSALPQKTTWEDSPRSQDFDTAADVFAYASEQMPPMEPGTIKDDDLWAILFYAFKQSQLVTAPPLNAGNASGVKLR